MTDQIHSTRYGLCIFFTVVCCLILFTSGPADSKPPLDQNDPRVIVRELKQLIRQKIENGENISKIKELDRQSKEAIMNGDQQEGIRLLKEALELARGNKPIKQSDTPETHIHTTRPAPEVTQTVEMTTVTLSVPTDTVVITEAVPLDRYEKGAQIGDADEVFDTKTITGLKGKLVLNLGAKPVFIDTSPQTATPNLNHDRLDSPFGIHGVGMCGKELVESGCSWVRLESKPLGAVWDLLEPKKDVFNWDLHDRVYLEFYKADIHMIAIIKSINRWDRSLTDLNRKPKFKYPNSIDRYANFVSTLVERYDGDGYKDAPGSPVVSYWQVENELDLHWKDTPERYADMLKAASTAIRKSDSNARVVMGALANFKGLDFFESVLRHLKEIKQSPEERFFDAVDLHWAGDAKGYASRQFSSKNGADPFQVSLNHFINEMKRILDFYGFGGTAVWINELSTYSGSPRVPYSTLANQTEMEHAIGLVKLFVYPLSLGVERSFWVTLHEWHGFGGPSNQYFDYVGLIHNPRNNGLNGKKLAYYTFRHLVEQTRGVKWNSIERIEVGEPNIIAFKLLKNNHPFYIVWKDAP